MADEPIPASAEEQPPAPAEAPPAADPAPASPKPPRADKAATDAPAGDGDGKSDRIAALIRNGLSNTAISQSAQAWQALEIRLPEIVAAILQEV